jgi:DNA polymerase
MTAVEKQQIYAFLEKAAYTVHGMPPPGFGETPLFADDSEAATSVPLEAAPPVETALPAHETINDIAADIRGCARCRLCETRANTVPGIGPAAPCVLVVGEAPGADEDAKGEPFVGRAGQLLDKMLASIALSRKTNCFIANTVKCRPPQNRDPLPDEEALCAPFLSRQIAALKPPLILAVGRVAAQKMLNTTDGIGRLRGRFFDYNGIPFMATYHPSALLRDETLKRPAWEDLKTFRRRLQELAPGYAQENGGF